MTKPERDLSIVISVLILAYLVAKVGIPLLFR